MTDFDDILAHEGPAIWRLTAGWERDRSAREDLYQEILLAIWRALPKFREESSLRTYVFRIAQHRCMTHVRRRRARNEVDPEEASLVDPAPGPERSAAARLELGRLQQAVRSLRPPLRQVLLLHLEGFSHREIAEIVGISEGNAAVRLHRARERLEGLLSTEESVPTDSRRAP